MIEIKVLEPTMHFTETGQGRAIEQDAFEKAARAIEEMTGNELYRKAWKAAAKAVRELKRG